MAFKEQQAERNLADWRKANDDLYDAKMREAPWQRLREWVLVRLAAMDDDVTVAVCIGMMVIVSLL